jgi:hypothetical protein
MQESQGPYPQRLGAGCRIGVQRWQRQQAVVSASD